MSADLGKMKMAPTHVGGYLIWRMTTWLTSAGVREIQGGAANWGGLGLFGPPFLFFVL
jgi:hypothetical protein